MNQLDLKGKNGIVTGGARGIGFAIASRLLQSGARVCLWDRDADALKEAKGKLSALGTVATQTVDLTNPDAVSAAAAATKAEFGSIELLVNNAGIAGVNGKLWEYTPDQWLAVVNTNLNAVFYVCRAVVPIMLEKQYGRIVNIASIAGKEGNPNASHYSASKAGLIALTKSLSKELATKGVLVNAVSPAAAKTAILDTMTEQHIAFMLSKIPMARLLEVGEAAAMIAWLASEDCSFSTGAVFDLSGGRATY